MNTRSKATDQPSLLAITKLLDIEEDIWSPTYGLKGKLDATVQGIISDPIPAPSSSPYSYNSTPSSECKLTNTPLPLELKTGRAMAAMEHRAQTMLYTLLLSERYGADVQDGLLFYTQSENGDVLRVPRGRNEIRGLITARNELAGYMWRRVRKPSKNKVVARAEVAMDVDEEPTEEDEEHFLPPPIDDERVCKRCYAQDTCFLFRKTHPNHLSTASDSKEGSTSKSKKKLAFDPPIPSFLQDMFEEKTGHLTPLQTKFFRDWERLLALEERDLVRFKRELWTLGAVEREKRGRCFSGMVLFQQSKGRKATQTSDSGLAGLVDVEVEEEGGWGKEGKIHRYTYSFARSKNWTMPSFFSSPTSSTSSSLNPTPPTTETRMQARNLLNGHLNIGDPITVSAEPLLALARGYIVGLTPEEVILGVDHVLDVDAIRTRLRKDPSHTQSSASPFVDEEVIFRIDKDELFGGMAKVRNNLAQLFYADGDRKRLELVVDLRKPVFSPPTPPFVPSSKTSRALNSCQQAAMEKVLSAEDYALVLGMPGTGKTTVIAALIKELVRRGKTVLLSSYTHSAVDTILMKMGGGKDDGEGGEFGILRLGNVDKVHPDVRRYTLNARKTASTVEALEMQLMAAPVVATTCLSVDQ